jgi:hypothetical protein
MNGESKGGFHIGSVGAGVSISAGGDVVAGDKVTTTSNTTITNGFKQDEHKEQFVHDIEELRTALLAIQAQIQQASKISGDDKDKIMAELTQQVVALKTAKDEASSLPVAKQASKDKIERIANSLDATNTLLDKVNALGAKAVEIGTTVKPYVDKALPLLLSARMLFGIP